MTNKIFAPIYAALIFAGFMLVFAFGLKLAEANALIDANLRDRAVQVVIGFMVVYFGNRIPKHVPQGVAACTGARARKMLRISGWAMTLAGLAYSALWVFAPRDLANGASMGAIISAMVVTLVAFGWFIAGEQKQPQG